METFKERRRFPRANIPCRITVISGLRILVFNANTENIGEGGVRVILEEKLSVATAVTLEIFPQEKEVCIKCKGEVAWVKENMPPAKENLFDTGIKFTNISNSNKEEIRSLVSAFFSKSGKAE